MTQESFRELYSEYESANIRHKEDLEIIVKLVSSERHVTLKEYQAQEMWEWYSEQYWAASWMSLGDEAQIIDAFELFVEHMQDTVGK